MNVSSNNNNEILEVNECSDVRPDGYELYEVKYHDDFAADITTLKIHMVLDCINKKDLHIHGCNIEYKNTSYHNFIMNYKLLVQWYVLLRMKNDILWTNIDNMKCIMHAKKIRNTKQGLAM